MVILSIYMSHTSFFLIVYAFTTIRITASHALEEIMLLLTILSLLIFLKQVDVPFITILFFLSTISYHLIM